MKNVIEKSFDLIDEATKEANKAIDLAEKWKDLYKIACARANKMERELDIEIDAYVKCSMRCILLEDIVKEIKAELEKYALLPEFEEVRFLIRKALDV